MEEFKHITVLLNEAVDGLSIVPDGIYVDCTFGRGGHSRLILSKLNEHGRLYAIDRDPQAIEEAKKISDPRFSIIHGRFSEVLNLLPIEVIGKVNGILMDFGVSSPQLDDANRGFSFMNDGPLDMRMDPSTGISAAEWLNRSSADEISKVLHDYGEERFAKKIANAIVNSREQSPFVSTKQLSDMVARVIPIKEKGKNPATRTFQGIRIFINSELDEITKVLESSTKLLAVKGRLVAISFHSLEDRLVKNFIKRSEKGMLPPKGLPVKENEILKTRTFVSIGKPIFPSDMEIEQNSRSRSAVLRIAERWSVENGNC
ncbi:MAG: 16S rRNA (cytosine(1402)-N(4))-methyltransferase RsmH [Succinivibrionaceae bacterium]